MARIHFSFHIDTADTEEAADIVRRLQGLKVDADPMLNHASNYTLNAPGAGAAIQTPEPEVEADPLPQEPAKKRGRPPKQTVQEAAAQLAAENPATETSSSGSPAETDAGDLSALEAELDGGAVELTLADVETKGREHVKAKGAPATMEIIKTHAAGATSFKQVKPEHFAAVHAALVADLAA
jgi:hypothetical protein